MKLQLTVCPVCTLTAQKRAQDCLHFTSLVVKVHFTHGLCYADSLREATAEATGTMIVLRVTTAKLGDELTRVLNAFLNQSKWKSQSTAANWQLFDVIGDFGMNETKQLVDRVSKWSLNRYCIVLTLAFAVQMCLPAVCRHCDPNMTGLHM